MEPVLSQDTWRQPEARTRGFMFFHRISAVLSSLVCAACFSTAASATTITEIRDASQISPNRTVFVDRDAPGTVYSGTSVSFMNGNNRLTFSRDGGGFETDQVGYNYGNSAFSNGTIVIGAGGFQGSGTGGPIRLAFTVPVVQFALNLEDFDLSGNGSDSRYMVNFGAYDTQGKLIVVPLSSTNGCTDNSCLALAGATVDGTSISYVLFNGVFPASTSSTNNLVFGNISYVPVGTALQAPAVTPEPSSFVLLGTGLISMATVGRRAMARGRKA